MRIQFTDTIGIAKDYTPTPAVQQLPEWFRKTPAHIGEQRNIMDGATPHTVKRCVPVFDAMAAGYIIQTYVDVQVTQREGRPYYEWPMFDAIAFHPVVQAEFHPANNGAPYPKFMNPWAIRTAAGTSCLILPPLHRPNDIFTILPGIVDTDTYSAPINFPFVLNDITWQGIIPAGTPLAQVIPFRRDSWDMCLGGDDARSEQAAVTTRLRSRWLDSYRKGFWSRKWYR